ncbi:MAG: hypothetical protein V1836_03660 [Candidatus Aenigmatarchaeota archaeon]
MVSVFKGESDQALMMVLVIVGFVILLGIAIALVVVIGRPSAMNAVPLIGNSLCDLLKGLRVKC